MNPTNHREILLVGIACSLLAPRTAAATEPGHVPSPAATAVAVPVPEPESPEPAGPTPTQDAPFPRVGGSLWSRYEARSNYAEHGLTHPRLHREGDYVVSRARLSVTTQPVTAKDGTRVSARFVPQAAYTWGENSGPAPTVSDHPTLDLYEGFARLESAWTRVDAGRFSMNYGDALVIGDLDWNESARAFNGVRVRAALDGQSTFVDLFATVISEGRAVTEQALAGDAYFWGAYAGLGPLLDPQLQLDAYFLGRSTLRNRSITVTDPADPDVVAVGTRRTAHELTLGARAKGAVGMADYRIESGIQFGQFPVEPNYDDLTPEAQAQRAYQADAEFGLTPIEDLRVSLEGLVASGDDLETSNRHEGYDELFPTGHKFLGLMDVVGPRTNVVSAVMHVSYSPMVGLKLSVDTHYFSRPRADASGAKGHMGTEMDTNLSYAFGNGASARGMYGVFIPEKSFFLTKTNVSPGYAGRTIRYFELQLGYAFN